MKLEQRDRMVKRVNAAFAKYPTFESVPVGSGPIAVEIKHPDLQRAYVEGFYLVCAKGDLVGRSKAGGILFGKPLPAPKADPTAGMES